MGEGNKTEELARKLCADMRPKPIHHCGHAVTYNRADGAIDWVADDLPKTSAELEDAVVGSR